MSSAVNCEQVELAVRARARRIRILRLVGAVPGGSRPGSGSASSAGSLAKSSRSRSSTDGRPQRRRGMEEREHEHGAPAELVHLRHPARPG